jgi:hypothetical protein
LARGSERYRRDLSKLSLQAGGAGGNPEHGRNAHPRPSAGAQLFGCGQVQEFVRPEPVRLRLLSSRVRGLAGRGRNEGRCRRGSAPRHRRRSAVTTLPLESGVSRGLRCIVSRAWETAPCTLPSRLLTYHFDAIPERRGLSPDERLVGPSHWPRSTGAPAGSDGHRSSRSRRDLLSGLAR